MVDTLGFPTVFFTNSAADLHWPELLRLMSSSESFSTTSSSTICRQALVENPAIADWFFHERIHQFIKHFYVDILGATDYWVRYEWQHRGSPHVHSLAWLPNSPDIQQILHSTDSNTVAVIYIYIYQYYNQESVRASVCNGCDVTSATCTLGTRLQRIP